MREQLDMVLEFHRRFDQVIEHTPSARGSGRGAFRHKIMREEVDEYLKGVENDDTANVAKEFADILYMVYGTIIEHGMQDIMEEVFAEVHRSNMTKFKKEGKPGKGPSYEPADIERILQKYREQV